MSEWAEPRDFREWAKRVFALRPILLLMMVCSIFILELRFDWMERLLGSYLVTTNSERPESGSIWEKRTRAYRPNPVLMEQAKAHSKKAKVTVFFSSWCKHCQRKVPSILRVEEELKDSSISFEYYGLPPGFAGEHEAEKYNITLIPTAIVRVDDKEIGRIENRQWDRPEAQLVGLLMR